MDIWSPIYYHLIYFLVVESGLLTFFHNQFRLVVEKKYLNTPEKKSNCWQKPMAYFAKKAQVFFFLSFKDF